MNLLTFILPESSTFNMSYFKGSLRLQARQLPRPDQLAWHILQNHAAPAIFASAPARQESLHRRFQITV